MILACLCSSPGKLSLSLIQTPKNVGMTRKSYSHRHAHDTKRKNLRTKTATCLHRHVTVSVLWWSSYNLNEVFQLVVLDMFCCTLLNVHSSIAIILMGKRELVALLNLSSWCFVMVERLFLAVPRGCLRFVIVIVVFPDHTHLLFVTFNGICYCITE